MRARRSQLLPLPPTDVIVQQDNHEYRLWLLEQGVRPHIVAAFTAPGVQSPQLFGPKWRARYDYGVVEASVTLGTAPGTGTATGAFWVNGSLAWSLDLVDGADTATLDLLEAPIPHDAVVQVSIEATAGAAADWVWQLTLRQA